MESWINGFNALAASRKNPRPAVMEDRRPLKGPAYGADFSKHAFDAKSGKDRWTVNKGHPVI